MEILNAVAHKVNKDRGVKGASLGEAKGSSQGRTSLTR